jgi:hypothetical protein
VAAVLNCQPSDVRILVAGRLLKPLGNPPHNSVKFFATVERLELVNDRAWLGKVTNALNQHWQRKNAAKQGRTGVSANVMRRQRWIPAPPNNPHWKIFHLAHRLCKYVGDS